MVLSVNGFKVHERQQATAGRWLVTLFRIAKGCGGSACREGFRIRFCIAQGVRVSSTGVLASGSLANIGESVTWVSCLFSQSFLI